MHTPRVYLSSTYQDLIEHRRAAAEAIRSADVETLRKALARVEAEGQKGDADARAAIRSARETGDTQQLQQVMVAEADRMGQAIVDQMNDYIQLCREIAEVAYLRGDIDEAERRLHVILKRDADDLDAVNRLGRIHSLHGNLTDAEASYSRVLELAGEHDEWRAKALGNLGLIYLTRGDLDQAGELWTKARDLYARIGIPHEVERVQRWLDELDIDGN